MLFDIRWKMLAAFGCCAVPDLESPASEFFRKASGSGAHSPGHTKQCIDRFVARLIVHLHYFCVSIACIWPEHKLDVSAGNVIVWLHIPLNPNFLSKRGGDLAQVFLSRRDFFNVTIWRAGTPFAQSHRF